MAARVWRLACVACVACVADGSRLGALSLTSLPTELRICEVDQQGSELAVRAYNVMVCRLCSYLK